MAKLLGGTTIYGDLSSQGVITDAISNSLNWQKGYNIATDYQSVSSTITDYRSISGTWLRASNIATDYLSISGTWLRASNTATDYRSVSSTVVYSNNSTINNIVQLTQVQYNALGTYALNTIYVIVG